MQAQGKTLAGDARHGFGGQEAIEPEGGDGMRDAVLVGTAKRVEYYEIAACPSANSCADALGFEDARNSKPGLSWEAVLAGWAEEKGRGDGEVTGLLASFVYASK